jgi:hypothetical protein
MVPITQMFREPEYASPINVRRVQSLAEQWDPLRCLDVVLSMRDDGRFAIIDGAHRQAACAARGNQPPVLPARVFIDLSLIQEAELFRSFNEDRRHPTRMDIFRAAWAAERVHARVIRSTCQEAGFDVAMDGHGANRIDAVSALEQMYTKVGQRGLLDILRIIAEAWGTDGSIKHTTHTWVLLGLMNFWARYVDSANWDRSWLVARLRASLPEIVLGHSQKHRTQKSGVTPPLAVGRVLLETYNHGRSAHKRLPEWQNHVMGEAAAARHKASRQQPRRPPNDG